LYIYLILDPQITVLTISFRLVLRWTRNGVTNLHRFRQLFQYNLTLLMRERIRNSSIETMDIAFKVDSGGILQEFVELLNKLKDILNRQKGIILWDQAETKHMRPSLLVVVYMMRTNLTKMS